MVRVATCIPQQRWLIRDKLDWLDCAIENNPCDIFLLPQEFFGGGSTREICRLKGISTDDRPVTPDWIECFVGDLAHKHQVHIGLGATVNRDGVNTEDYLYIDPSGRSIGYHSKIALPVQDSIVTNGASQVTPETDFVRASRVIELPLLGIRVGTVFCWQVYFTEFWNELAKQKCSLVVHPIKFAPRAWYQKGTNPDGQFTRTGFQQNSGSEKPEDDALGWIRKLKYESEFKELPIAVTCNTWSAGEKYLALVGWVDETCQRTNLENLPSTSETERVIVTTYDPSLYDELDHLSLGVYARFKEVWPALAAGTMRRKAVRIEKRTLEGKTIPKVAAAQSRISATREQESIFEQPE